MPFDSSRLSRRVFVVALTSSAFVACAAPASPTPAPAKPTTSPAPTAAPKPTTAPAPTAAAKPTAAPAKTAPTAPAKPTISAKPTTWHYGTFSANLQDTPFLAGSQKGIFQKYGATIEPTFLNSSVIAMQGLNSGEFDFISLNFLGEVALIAGGATMRVLGSSAQRLNQVLASEKSIGSIKDLAGKSVAFNGPGSLPDILLDLLLARAGLKPDDVQKVNAGATPQVFATLQTGQVDAAMVDLDLVGRIEADPNLKILSLTGDELPNFVTSGICVTDQTLKEKPNEVVALLAATAESIRYVYDNRAEVVKYMAGEMKREESALGNTYDQYVKYKIWPKNLDLTADQINYMQDVNIQIGRQSAKVPVDQIADFSYREKALAIVGKV